MPLAPPPGLALCCWQRIRGTPRRIQSSCGFTLISSNTRYIRNERRQHEQHQSPKCHCTSQKIWARGCAGAATLLAAHSHHHARIHAHPRCSGCRASLGSSWLTALPPSRSYSGTEYEPIRMRTHVSGFSGCRHASSWRNELPHRAMKMNSN